MSITALNDSKYIATSVYNVVAVCAAGVSLDSTLEHRPGEEFALLSVFIVWCTSVTLCLVFVPKVGVGAGLEV